jgi:hypothetical protein
VSSRQTGNSRIVLVGRNAGLLAVAIVGTLLSAKIWVPVAFFLVDTFPENPVLAGTFFPSSASFSFFAFSAPGMRPRSIYLVSRAILLFLSVVAAIASMEAISFGFISVTVTPSREGFVWLSIAIVLVAFAALGIKAALDWRLSYWIVFPAVFATLIFATFGLSIFSLM